MLEAQQRAAMAVGSQLRLHMQVRRFDAVGHRVAAGLGIATPPKGVALPIARAKKLAWRPLADGWAKRQLQICMNPEADSAVLALRDFLVTPSQTAKSGHATFEWTNGGSAHRLSGMDTRTSSPACMGALGDLKLVERGQLRC